MMDEYIYRKEKKLTVYSPASSTPTPYFSYESDGWKLKINRKGPLENEITYR